MSKKTATTIWQGIRMELPASWEMTRYGKRHESGVCTFMDELHERLQVSWQRTDRPPDLDRLVSDLRSRELTDNKDLDAAPQPEFESFATQTPWHGVAITRGGTSVTRAARYFPGEEILLEIAILWPDRRDMAREEELLRGIQPQPNADRRVWQAFGVQAELPAALHLFDCKCLPGDTELQFQGDGKFPRVTIHRLAFPSVWLKEPLHEWLQGKLPEHTKIERQHSRTTPGGHALERIASRPGRGRLGWLLGLRFYRTDWACLCPEERRVYHVILESVRPDEDLVALHCGCGPMITYRHKAP